MSKEIKYLIEATKHSGDVINLGPYDTQEEMWDTIKTWDLPAGYIIDLYHTKEEMLEFLESINFSDKIPDIKYPVTIYVEGLFSFNSYDENFDYYLHKDKTSLKLKEFLWEAHFHDYPKVLLYILKDNTKEKVIIY